MSYQIEIKNKEGRAISVVDVDGDCPLSIGHWIDLRQLIEGVDLEDTSYIVSDIYWAPNEENEKELTAFVHISPANSYEDRRKILKEKGWL